MPHLRSSLGAALAAGLCSIQAPVAGAQCLGTELVLDGLDRPVFATQPPGDTGRLFVVELQTGLIRLAHAAPGGGWTLSPTPFLDVSAKISTAWQQGFFSVAFHPDYDQNGRLYVYYTDVNTDSVLERYTVSAVDPDVADPASASTVMVVLQTGDFHRGGMAAFGPDGYLYWALGDGGPRASPVTTHARSGPQEEQGDPAGAVQPTTVACSIAIARRIASRSRSASALPCCWILPTRPRISASASKSFAGGRGRRARRARGASAAALAFGSSSPSRRESSR
jgi:glucose/arabinose dehydrogenase